MGELSNWRTELPKVEIFFERQVSSDEQIFE